MPKLSVAEMAQVVKGRLFGSRDLDLIEDIVTDSRRVKPGSLFIAIKGENFDGYNFAEEALRRGAAAVLATRSPEAEDSSFIVVEDYIEAMALLGRYCLEKYPVKIVAVTGSVGKTSTKELIASVLSSEFRVLKSEGNLNTETGLPITLYGLEPEHEVAVLEMGMVGPGEIRHLTRIAPPHIAVITNVYGVHLERLGSLKAIAQAKAEIIEALDTKGLAVYRSDEDWSDLFASLNKGRIVKVGFDAKSDLFLSDWHSLGFAGSAFKLNFADGRVIETTLGLPGKHMAENALFAAAAAYELGMSPEKIGASLALIKNIDQRSQVLILKGNRSLINDCYNASPASMEASLKLVAELGKERLAALVLADMKELGQEEEIIHLKLGQRIAQDGFKIIVTKGRLAQLAGREALASNADIVVKNFSKNSDIVAYLKESLPQNSILLIKGSRSMALDSICPELIEFWGVKDE